MQSDADYSGMTTNERLFAAGRLDDFDNAARCRDVDAMIAILVTVQFTMDEARSIAETCLATPEKYGF